MYSKKEVLRERGKETNKKLKQKSKESIETLGEFLEKAEKRK
jgi:hypothetical protein